VKLVGYNCFWFSSTYYNPNLHEVQIGISEFLKKTKIGTQHEMCVCVCMYVSMYVYINLV
jgi:hypothetical protein